MADIQYYGTGRRKTSTARVYLRPGNGKITVNKREFDAYFPNEALQMIIRQPLSLTETAEKFDIYVNVDGGGTAGQAGAVTTPATKGGDGPARSQGTHRGAAPARLYRATGRGRSRRQPPRSPRQLRRRENAYFLSVRTPSALASRLLRRGSVSARGVG